MKIGFLDESKGTATQRCTKHGQRLSMVKGIRSKWLERSGTRGVRKLLHVAEGYETYKGKGNR